MKTKPSQLLRSKSRWTQGEYARSKFGNKIDLKSSRAVSWCLDGALCKCLKTVKEVYKAYDVINEILVKEKMYYHGLINWNDELGRKHSEVVALLKKAGY